jgi:hypothetical protein
MREQTDVVKLEDVPSTSAGPGGSRRWLLKRAAMGAAGVAAASALDPAGAALAWGGKGGHGKRGGQGGHGGHGGQSPVLAFGTVAVTTEALTVTLLTEVLRRAKLNSVPAGDLAVFEGAYAAEVDHFQFTSQHWNPTTTSFWIPDGFFGGSGNTLDLTAIGTALVAGETLFVNLYLIGVTAFAQAGNEQFARFSAEIAGVEAEHRTLAETLVGASPPNNVGFEAYSIQDPQGIESALEGAGIGFGAQGNAPGAFYNLPNPIMAPPVPINSNMPE